MLLEKKPLSLSDIEAQTVLELPPRETFCSYVVTWWDEFGEEQGSMETGDVNIAINMCQQIIAINSRQQCRIQQKG